MSVKAHAEKMGYHFGHMTIGQCMETAETLNMRVGDVILEEAVTYTGQSREQVVENMEAAFAHNIKAATIGLTKGHSILLGEIGKDLNGGEVKIVDDAFVNRIVTITLAAQVGRILSYNKAVRHLRGGEATRRKYQSRKNESNGE